jgi:hypothetical protein
MEDFLLHDRAAIVHLDLDEVGVDAVDCRAESFKENDESRTESTIWKRRSL